MLTWEGTSGTIKIAKEVDVSTEKYEETINRASNNINSKLLSTEYKNGQTYTFERLAFYWTLRIQAISNETGAMVFRKKEEIRLKQKIIDDLELKSKTDSENKEQNNLIDNL